jgi:high-affinity nickel-transport protein
MNFLPLIALGFLLGVKHATEPDHVVAVSTIVTRNRKVKMAALLGAAWGVGHTLTIFVVGGLLILTASAIPARLGLGMESCVSVMLVGLGISNLLKRAKICNTCDGTGSLPDTAGLPSVCDVCAGTGKENVAPHSHEETGLLRSLCVGVVHGLAGSAAVVLLVLATIREPLWAIFYLLIFGLGTVLGMSLVTLGMAVPLLFTKHSVKMNRVIALTSNLISIGFGMYLFYVVAILGGLFSHAVRWKPQ